MIEDFAYGYYVIVDEYLKNEKKNYKKLNETK